MRTNLQTKIIREIEWTEEKERGENGRRREINKQKLSEGLRV